MRGKQLPMMRHGACEVSALTSSAPPSAAAPDSRYQGRSNGRSATASPPVLRVSGLVAGYGDDRAAVHGLDLEIYVGEVVAPLGPSGAGTTNAQLTLAGELPQMAGQVDYMGRPLKGPLHHRVRGGLGFVSEERSVFMGLSVADNLKIAARPDRALGLFPELKQVLRRRAGCCPAASSKCTPSAARWCLLHRGVLAAVDDADDSEAPWAPYVS